MREEGNEVASGDMGGEGARATPLDISPAVELEDVKEEENEVTRSRAERWDKRVLEERSPEITSPL